MTENIEPRDKCVCGYNGDCVGHACYCLLSPKEFRSMYDGQRVVYEKRIEELVKAGDELNKYLKITVTNMNTPCKLCGTEYGCIHFWNWKDDFKKSIIAWEKAKGEK